MEKQRGGEYRERGLDGGGYDADGGGEGGRGGGHPLLRLFPAPSTSEIK